MDTPASDSSNGIITATITSMAYGGKGIARVDGKVVFIDGAIPGDVVDASLVEDKGRYADALLVALREPSPLRGPSPCPVSDACGGCQWQGVPYEQQLLWKRGFVEAALQRIGKLPGDTAPALEMFASPSTQAYRNRVLIRLHVQEDGRVELGYFRRGTHQLVPIDRCAIAASAINAGIAALSTLSDKAFAGLRVRIELQEVEEPAGQLVLTLYPSDGASRLVEEFAARVRTLPLVHWAGLVFDLPEAPLVPLESDLGIRFLTQPGQFQQVNLALNRVLRRLVRDHVEAVQPTRVLDLFCGSGNLSLPLANGVRYVEGAESNKKAIGCAKQTAALNGITGTVYLAGDAEKHLWKCSKAGETFDLVILDPPRQGMYRGMIPLKNLAPAHIIYVSCDPTTLARDLGALCKKDRYQVDRLVALDFFPNTHHVETVAFLRRS